MQFEIDVMLDYQLAEPADVLLQVEVAQMADQRLLGDRLTVTSEEPLAPVMGGDGIGQRTWARGAGVFHATYSAIVEVDRPRLDLVGLAQDRPGALPADAIAYLMPSRYIESERFESFVRSRFGDLDGGAKIAAMLDWTAREMAYVSGTSSGTTTAMMSFVQREGVCRDYAHLFAAFARAAGIPARLVSAYAPGVTPPDFHAVVEVWLSGSWHLVDPTGMAHSDEIVRVCVGRDATDIAFMTVFGIAEFRAQSVAVRRIDVANS